MFGDERASAKDISLFFFVRLARGMAQRFPRQRNWRRTCMCVIPPPTFANLITIESQAKHPILAQSVNRFLRYGNGVGTCARADAPHPWPVESISRNDPQPTHQIWTQSAEPFLRYRSAVCTCARADIPHPWLLHALQLMGPQLHTKFQHNWPSRYRVVADEAFMENEVRTCGCTPSMTCLKETSQIRYANLSEIAVLLPVTKKHRSRCVSAQNTREKNLLLIEI